MRGIDLGIEGEEDKNNLHGVREISHLLSRAYIYRQNKN